MTHSNHETGWRLEGYPPNSPTFSLKRVKEFTTGKLRSASIRSLLPNGGRQPSSYGFPRALLIGVRWPFKIGDGYFRLERPELGEVEQLPEVSKLQVIQTIQATGVVPIKRVAFKALISRLKRACSNWNPRLVSFRSLIPDLIPDDTERKVNLMRLSIDKLITGEWMSGLQLVTLKLDLIHLSYESQAWIFEGLKLNSLQSLTVWNMYPSDRSITQISQNLPSLREMDIFYATDPEPGVRVIPDLASLQCVSLSSLGGNFNCEIQISSHHVLENLRRVDLGHFTFRPTWVHSTFPMAPQVEQLTTYGTHPTNFIEFHFPNLKLLSYFTPNPESLVCVSRLPHLQSFAFASTPTLPTLTNQNLISVDLFNRISFQPEFWVWLTESFPNLSQLRLFSTSLSDYAFPDPTIFSMPNLKALACQFNFPMEFWVKLRTLAPNVRDTSHLYF